jgi:hypothetical protein
MQPATESETLTDFKPIAYWSRIVSKTERRWPIVQLELNAIVMALRHFQSYVYNCEIIVHSDHRPLIYLLRKKSTHPNLARWLVELQQYDLHIEHVPGTRNKVADALSRIADSLSEQDVENVPEAEDKVEFPISLYPSQQYCNTTTQSIETSLRCYGTFHPHDAPIMAEAQRKDKELGPVFDALSDGLFPEDPTKRNTTIWYTQRSKIRDDGVLLTTINGEDKITLPSEFRYTLFDGTHNSQLGGGHLGVNKSLRKCSKYFWKEMRADFTRWRKQCHECQLRSRGPPKIPIRPTITTTNFERVGVDLCGPFPETSRGNKYIVNFVDWFSKYIISVPAPNAKSATVAELLVEHVILKFGVPKFLLSDNATTFTAAAAKELCEILKTKKIFSTPHHSEGNPVTERSFRTFHDMIAKARASFPIEFDELLSALAFNYNCSVHSTTLETPFYLTFGRDPILPIDSLLAPEKANTEDNFKTKLTTRLHDAWKICLDTASESLARTKDTFDRSARPSTISPGDLVLMRNYASEEPRKFKMAWKTIYRVISRDDIHAVIISTVDPFKPPKSVHLNQIKQYFPSPFYPIGHPNEMENDEDHQEINLPPIPNENEENQENSNPEVEKEPKERRPKKRIQEEEDEETVAPRVQEQREDPDERSAKRPKRIRKMPKRYEDAYLYLSRQPLKPENKQT